MNFRELSERFFSSSEGQRQASTLEYRSSCGSLIAPDVRSADETTLLRGNGSIEYRRRGDFGERGDCPPGIWISECDRALVDRIWDKLGNLGPDSFPSRVADPGDAIQYIAACVSNGLARLSIGPEDPSKPIPGEEFMRELYPVLGQPESGECLWAVEMSIEGMVKTSDGSDVRLAFRNPGNRTIGLVFEGAPGVSDFTLRFRQKREDNPYPQWFHAKSKSADADRAEIVPLDPGSAYERIVPFLCGVPGEGSYMGAVAYRQTRYLDSLAGHPILSGMAFTAMTEFRI